jgi:hypothetical protein
VLVAELNDLPGLVPFKQPHTPTGELETVNILPPIVQDIAEIAKRYRSVVWTPKLDNSSLAGLLGQLVQPDEIESLTLRIQLVKHISVFAAVRYRMFGFR